MALEFETASVDDQFGAFVDAGLDPLFDPGAMLRADDRAVMRVIVGRDADAQRIDRGDQLFAQRIGGLVADRHDDRQRHAAFARAAEGGTRQIGDDLIEIGVGHDDAVVLRAAHRLDALARLDPALVDVMRDVATIRRS